MSIARLAAIIPVTILTMVLSPISGACRAGQDQPQPHSKANKMHPDVPDIAIWEVQYLGRTGPDPKGEMTAELIRAKIKNWTTDRTITGVLWEISVLDVDKQKVAEVLIPYTYRDMVSPDLTLKVAPGYLIEIPFYITRQVHIDGNHSVDVKIKSYTYKKFDVTTDKKPENVSYLIAEDWPYKDKTEPVLIEKR